MNVCSHSFEFYHSEQYDGPSGSNCLLGFAPFWVHPVVERFNEKQIFGTEVSIHWRGGIKLFRPKRNGARVLPKPSKRGLRNTYRTERCYLLCNRSKVGRSVSDRNMWSLSVEPSWLPKLRTLHRRSKMGREFPLSRDMSMKGEEWNHCCRLE